MSRQRTQRGYSLTEVMVGIAIFTLIFIAALLLYDRANKVFKSSVQSSDVQQNTRVAFERLMSELRMAGFDHDRDGFPQGSQKYQQPDEQLEYVHKRAVTFRANLDYESDAATDNGRETAYEPGFTTTASTTDDYFPIVTTGNDEIITYFLRSETSSANDDSITFYADVARPRRTYPVTGPGQNETLITISNVDLCQDGSGADTGCKNPPYTLYRVTLNTDGSVGTPVPVATNIRNLEFTYFKDAIATEVETPNGGGGQYIVTGGSTSAAAIAARSLRENIRSMRVSLVGMSESGDSGYQEPIEVALTTDRRVAAAVSHRQYQLESTVVPRNLGKRGLQEIDIKRPGNPDITAVCVVGCGVVKVKWNAPNIGTVTAYSVVYDTNPSGTFNSATTDAGRNLYAYVSGLTPGEDYHFKVIAENAHGSGISTAYPTASPGVVVVNRTQPEAPTNLRGTGGTATGAGAAINNNIELRYTAPQNNLTYNGTPPTNSCSESEPTINAQAENSGYTIKRSLTAGFDPNTTGDVVYDGDIGGANEPTASGSNVTYVDKSQKLNCTTYYYAVRAKDFGCSTTATLNSSGELGQAFSPWSVVFDGQSTAAVAPAVPGNPSIAPGSSCVAPNCTINVQWPEVVTDANGVSIYVKDYVLRRQTYNAAAALIRTETIDVTDTTIGNGTVSHSDAFTWHASGYVHKYTVAAKQCSLAPSSYTTFEAQFPCGVLSIDTGSSTLLDGTGVANDPWMLDGSSAQIRATSTETIISASATSQVYDPVSGTTSGTPTVLTGGLSGIPPVAAWSLSLSSPGTVYQITMTITDDEGCVQTERRYVQDAPVGCCLSPFKVASTVFDSSVLTVAPFTANNDPRNITVTLKNLCDDVLTIESIKMQWTIGTPANNLSGGTLPHTTSGTVPFTGDTDGSVTITPSSITNAKTTIAGDGTYDVVFTLSRGGSTSETTISTVCVQYTRNAVVGQQCNIVQNAGVTCPF